jgi:trk system potassium uptake protein TrkA
MKQFAVIGLSTFGRRMLEELLDYDCEILIIDKNQEVIQKYQDKVTSAYVANAINEEIIKKLVPNTLDAAVIDLGDKIEVSILVTNYLKKIGVKEIIAKAESDEHGEILELVGASKVVFPNREAAKSIAPLLLSSLIFRYLPVSKDFVIAEVKVPAKFIGMTLIQANIRRELGLNVIAFGKENSTEYHLFSPEHILQEDDIFLIGGREADIIAFTQGDIRGKKKKKKGILQRFFSRFRSRG